MTRAGVTVLLASVLVTLPAAGDPPAPPRVALVLADPAAGASGLHARLAAELAAAGFEHVVVRARERPDLATLSATATRTGSFAAIAVFLSETGLEAELWVIDRVTGKALVRTIEVDPGEVDAARVFALRAVELLRASLLELRATHPPRGQVDAPDEVRVWAAPVPTEPRRWSLQLAATALPGLELPLAAGVGARLDVRVAGGWAVGIALTGLAVSTLERAAGSARLDQSLLSLRVAYRPGTSPERGASEWSASALLGAGIYRLGVDGVADDPARARSEAALSAAVEAGGGLHWEPTPGALLGLEATAGVLAPRPGVRVGDSEPRFTGRPFLSSSLLGGLAW